MDNAKLHRRSKIEEKSALLLKMLRRGRSIADSSQIAGITRQTLHNWLNRAETLDAPDEYIQFYFDYHEARGVGVKKLIDGLDRYDNETETTVVEKVDEEKGVIETTTTTKKKRTRPSHFVRNSFLLRSQYPERWGNRSEPDDAEFIETSALTPGLGTDTDAPLGLEWRNPDLHAFRSDNCRAITGYKGTELVVSGPTRSGKTLRILEFLFALLFTYPGLRILICRSKEVDLRDTIKVDIRDTLLKFDLDDPLSPVEAIGGRNFTHLEANGGRITFGGMDRPGKILGTKYDIVYYSQIEQSTPEEYQKLKTRCSGDSKNWIDPTTGEVRYLLIGDANPAQDSHYLLEREDEGLTDIIHFGFDDNPLFFRGGDRTPDGDRVIGELDKSLTGIYHDRLFKGLWISAEGVVFPEFAKKRHVKQIEKPQEGVWLIAVDFGFKNPACALLINYHDGILTVWREIYKVGLQLDDFIIELRQMLDAESVSISIMLCDHQSEHVERLQQEGFPAVLAEKQIITGLERIRARLMKDTLVIAEHVNRSPDPNIDKGPKGLVDEFGVYSYISYDKRQGNAKDDIPMDKDNHAIDPLRYGCNYLDNQPQLPPGMDTIESAAPKSDSVWL